MNKTYQYKLEHWNTLSRLSPVVSYEATHVLIPLTDGAYQVSFFYFHKHLVSQTVYSVGVFGAYRQICDDMTPSFELEIKMKVNINNS